MSDPELVRHGPTGLEPLPIAAEHMAVFFEHDFYTEEFICHKFIGCITEYLFAGIGNLDDPVVFGIDGKKHFFNRMEDPLQLFALHNLLLTAHGWALKQWRLSRWLDLDAYVERELDLLLRAIRP